MKPGSKQALNLSNPRITENVHTNKILNKSTVTL